MVSFTKATFRAHGAVNDLFYCRDSEVLLEGPAGTGKTRGLLEYIYWLCVTFPGIRVLLVRKTRASLNESVLVTWEQKVLPNSECITGTAAPPNRQSYTFPHATNYVHGERYSGESHVVLGGMDKPTKIMSTEFDIVAAFESNELTENDWEMLLSRNRNYRMPWQQMIADTNPDADTHWLNRRAKKLYVVPPELATYLPPARPGQTQMTRLLSKHQDNPLLWDHVRQRWTLEGALYMRKLHALTGARAGRLLRGEWVGSEGQIWSEFSRERHMVYRTLQDDRGKAILDGHPRDADGTLRCDWYFASMDFGFRNPGCLQVWGVIGQFERLYRLHEWYAPGKQLDWWAEQVVRYDKRYGLQAVVCDPARDDAIATINSRICDYRGRGAAHIALGADNSREVGWDTVREGLHPQAALEVHARPGEEVPRIPPRLFLCWDALEHRDEALAEAEKPCCTEDEIGGYVWKTTADGRPVKEEPDPLAPDHGCDAMRYAAMYAWGRDLTPEDRKPKVEPGTMADVCGHDEVSFEAA